MEQQFPFVLESILDNDFYKITMQCAVIRLYPDVKAKYRFINRGEHLFPGGFGAELVRQVNKMANLSLSKQEKQFLALRCPYLNPAYLDFLQGYRYDPAEVSIVQNGTDLEVSVEGYWYRTILWEVPLLALISELFYKMQGAGRISNDALALRTSNKMNVFKDLGVTVAEFGTRRRHSLEVHKKVLDAMMAYPARGFVGTSNVHLAMLHDIKIIGTHAHEWFMFHGARYGYKIANDFALRSWVKVFKGDLGIALTDTYTTEVFFAQFHKQFAKLFDGVRHDSGDPVLFAERTIRHYQRLGINPLHKTIIFSDGLNPEKVATITRACQDRIGISFGIGTNLTNDVGLQPMNIVMKLVEIATPGIPWTATVKLSDEPGKQTGDPQMVRLARELLGITSDDV
ncbi:MAG TPA: nicotinate phosphoribosyltransferase [Niabella sp.]|nr:nicotinate phosphoribosyltransferase [Niabella sp.]